MPASLPLVIEAATLVDDAAAHRRALDVHAAAARLLADHPESDAAPDEIVALLRHEQAAVARVAAVSTGSAGSTRSR
jgi:hypothetical protein